MENEIKFYETYRFSGTKYYMVVNGETTIFPIWTNLNKAKEKAKEKLKELGIDYSGDVNFIWDLIIQ